MLEISTSPENSGAPEGRGSGPDSDGFKEQKGLAGEEADRNSTANRWPQQETMALLKIRSEMDVAFRDINPRAPLWQQVSRKLAELGYNRSAKKCKEKFENIYKYHRRTKEGRYGRPNAKTYRFFEQLEALASHLVLPENNPTKAEGTATTTNPVDLPNVVPDATPCSIRFPSSTKESGEDVSKKNRKLTGFFQRLVKEVIEKQETLHDKFMEVLEKCEQDRIAREEAWKMQALDRINRERELLAQERSVAAAKDAAMLAFLKKFTEQAGPVQLPENIAVQQNLIPDHDKDKGNEIEGTVMDKQECTNVENFIQMSSSRWPKDQVEALIRLRTNLDMRYEGNGLKGPLWEEISTAMKKLGYHRSAKRCKEKWENINKYFKRMKGQNKRRPDDSKTCPYYHQLEALYSKKPRTVQESAGFAPNELKPEELLMHIMSGQEERQQLESSSEDADKEKNSNQIEGDKEDGDEDGYHMAASSSSIAITG